MCGSQCNLRVYTRQQGHRGLSFSRGSVIIELCHQAFASVCCEAGLCSVFLSVLTLPSPVSRGKASFMVWNPALVPTWDPVVCQKAFSFLPLFGAWGVPACSDSRHRTVIHRGRTAHVSPACLSWEWLPACPPTFCLPFSLGQNAASLILPGASWAPGAHP